MEPLDFAEWIEARSPEYYRMVQHMVEYRVTCDDVIEWIKSTHEGQS